MAVKALTCRVERDLAPDHQQRSSSFTGGRQQDLAQQDRSVCRPRCRVLLGVLAQRPPNRQSSSRPCSCRSRSQHLLQLPLRRGQPLLRSGQAHPLCSPPGSPRPCRVPSHAARCLEWLANATASIIRWCLYTMPFKLGFGLRDASARRPLMGSTRCL